MNRNRWTQPEGCKIIAGGPQTTGRVSSRNSHPQGVRERRLTVTTRQRSEGPPFNSHDRQVVDQID